MAAILTRRNFMKTGAAMVSVGWSVPAFLAQTAGQIERAGTGVAHAAGEKILVLVQLAGGNDGLNTVVPYTDATYYSQRGSLAIAQNSVLNLNGSLGLHPSLPNLRNRYSAGQLAIIQGMSYPNPNRSHFRGMDILESAIPNRVEQKGWIGRYFEACGCRRPDSLEGMALGIRSLPRTFWTDMALVPAVGSLASFRYGALETPYQRSIEIPALRNLLSVASGNPEEEFLRAGIKTAMDDADILQNTASSYNPVGSYPATAFGEGCKFIAQVIAGNVGTRVFFVSLGGFDTHSNQPGMHAGLLAELDQAMEAFLRDMEHQNKMQDVTVVTFSEFGRRLAKNGSEGTDHGVAAPMFMLGGSINGGIHGTHPSLTDLTDGDLKMGLDFRQVYATILQDWLFMNPTNILEGNFTTLPLFAGATPPPNCSPRPAVRSQITRVAPGKLQVTLTAGGGLIRQVQFSAGQNALIETSGQAPRVGGFTIFPNAAQATFYVTRQSGSGSATMPLTVVDDCGSWQTMVGGGPAAF